MSNKLVSLDEILASMEQPNPYSQEQVNNASQDAVRQAEKATANAETVSSKTPQLIDIVSSTFDDVDAALKKQQELMPQQIEVAKRRDKIATKLNRPKHIISH